MNKPGILRNLRVKRVSLVDSGANLDTLTGDGAHIMLFKAGPDSSAVHVDVPLGSKKKKEIPVAKTFKEVIKNALGLMAEPDEAKRKEGLESLSKAVDDVPDPEPVSKHDDKNPDCACGEPVCLAKKEEVKKAALEAEAKKTDIEKKFDAVQKRADELEAANKELTKTISVEKSMRLNNEMYAILKSFKATPFNLEGEDSDVIKFRKMKEESPEMFERTMALFKAADAQMASSALFSRELGTQRTGTGSAYDQLVAKANSLVEKSTDGMTFEKAMDKVQLAHPELVKQYRAEQQ